MSVKLLQMGAKGDIEIGSFADEGEADAEARRLRASAHETLKGKPGYNPTRDLPRFRIASES